MKPGSTAYLERPHAPSDTDDPPGDAPERVLAPATIVGLRPGRIDLSVETEALDTESAPVTLGDERCLYFDLWLERRFVQQTARIEAVHESGRRSVLELQITSDALPAERRRHRRVPALNTGAAIEFEGRSHPLLDVSLSGFALVSKGDLEIGRTLDVELSCGDQRIAGRACVRSRRALHRDNARYGLEVENDGSDETPLAMALAALTEDIERTEQRRRQR